MHLLSCILGRAIMRTSNLGHRLPALPLLRVSHPTGTKGQEGILQTKYILQLLVNCRCVNHISIM